MRLVDIAPMLEFLDLQHYDKDMDVSQYSADWIYSWLESQPTIEQPTWISVEDRLPKCGEIVFCNTQNFFEVLQWDERADVWVGAYRSYWKEYVTHWMPLPQPPKGVE